MIKKKLSAGILAATLLICLPSLLSAQETIIPYFPEEDLPDVVQILPPPPGDPSMDFDHDILRYMWGKMQRRDSLRLAMAVRDAVWNLDTTLVILGEPFGLTVSKEGTPAIYELLTRGVTTIENIRFRPKAHYFRIRPFAYFKEPSIFPQDDEWLATEGSYPSGHTIRAWACALLMAQINPASAEAVFARAWKSGESRVISGCHWQSDVDASRPVAGIGFSRLQSSPEFQRQMVLAQEEYRRLTGGAQGGTEWLSRLPGFEDRFTLEQAVVLSRHNIRTPLIGKGSLLPRITDSSYEWFPWEEAAGHLTAKGERLETRMGTFFRQWLEKKALLSAYSPDGFAFRFYSKARQRCQLTAHCFADALLPGADPRVEMNIQFDKMDPVFHPQITKLTEGIESRSTDEMKRLFGDLDAPVEAEYRLIEEVIGITRSPAYPDTVSFSQFPSETSLVLNAEPRMTGGLKMACSVSDALVLQYYEERDAKKAAFGHDLSQEEWTRISSVKDWYQDVLFTAPSVAANLAHPLLLTMLGELQNEKRVFSFLCGHDSNIASVLASLGAEPYVLPASIEQTTPIGCKMLVEKFRGNNDGVEYADLWLVYASTDQLRNERELSYDEPPMAVQIRLKGLSANPDGLYLFSELEQRFAQAIKAYDTL